jgi:hypothetical protein
MKPGKLPYGTTFNPLVDDLVKRAFKTNPSVARYPRPGQW